MTPTPEKDAPKHDTIAHVLAGGFGVHAEGCPACNPEPRHNHDPIGVYPNCPACGTVTPPAGCPTQGCPGDVRYAAPGRGHIEGCTYS